MKNKITLLVAFVLLSIGIGATDNVTIQSEKAELTFEQNKEGKYFPKLKTEGSQVFYQQLAPLMSEIVTDHNTYWLEVAYESVKQEGKAIVAKGQAITNAGSVLKFADTYNALGNSMFEMSRNVTVENVQPLDKGFSTRIAFKSSVAGKLDAFDFFVPSIWYKNNAYVPEHALASNYNDNNFWFREDRLPIPLVMLRDIKSGLTFSIVSSKTEATTFKEEDGLNRIIDERLKFSSVGFTDNTHPSIGVTYPGSEGERTYINGRSTEKRWALRSHPIKEGVTHNYTVAFSLSHQDDYNEALHTTWNNYYELVEPQIYDCDLELIYQQQIDVLDRYWKCIGESAGVPFGIYLNGEMKTHLDYNFNMGFVGHQPGNAYLLIREGFRTDNVFLRAKGEQMADFWAHNAMTPSGCPKTWYDPYPDTWRGPEVALREIGDGMVELLRAWNIEKEYGRNKATWLNACVMVADWVVGSQQMDGSFFSHFDYNTGKHTKEHKNCTSHIIPYLVEMYLATNDIKYKDAAVKAGNYIYDDLMNDYKYVGGAIDNPNVMDKEAGSMALRAFLALYDAEKTERWLDGAIQAARFYQTWVVAKDIPIPQGDPEVVFPAHRSVVGQSIIATGHSAADTYAAIDALGFYRVYLYTGDKQMLHLSKMLQRNTKQFMNWDLKNDPLDWIAEGLFGEAMNVSIPRGRGVGFYLPWATYNQMEPLVYLEDIFGHKDIESIEKLSEKDKKNKHKHYSDTRLYGQGKQIEDTDNSNQLNVFPNPVDSFFVIDTKKPIDVLKLYDINGFEMLNKTSLDVGRHNIDVSRLKSGLYILTTVSENKKSSEKIKIK